MKLCAFADEASSATEGQIDALKRNGFSYVEVRGVDGKNVKKLTDTEAKEFRKRLDDEGLAVWSIGSPIGKYPLDRDPSHHFDEFKRVIELAYMLGTQRIRMFSFYPIKGESNDTTRARVFERLEKMCALTPSDIILCHENEKEIFGENAENCLAIHNAFPKIRGVFDPANFVQCGVNTLVAWEMLKEHIDYLHIKDAAPDGTVVPAGMGIGNVQKIVKRYLAQGGDAMTLEPHLHDFVGLSVLENGQSLKADVVKRYANNREAFDAAADALKSILEII